MIKKPYIKPEVTAIEVELPGVLTTISGEDSPQVNTSDDSSFSDEGDI